MLLRSILATCVIAGSAAAECPTGAAIESGVKFALEDGGHEVHRKVSPDRVLLVTRSADDEITLIELKHGLYLSYSVAVEDNVPLINDFLYFSPEPDISEWPEPKPDAIWENTTPTGGKAISGKVSTMKIGECDYDAYEVTLTPNDDPTLTEFYQYLPALGTSLLVGVKDADGFSEFQYTQVEAL